MVEVVKLVRYEAARHALQIAHSVDEVKDIRDKAEAMAAYARQAKDTQLVQYATEIKVRAERKAGELLAATARSGDRASKGRPVNGDKPSTLKDLGISEQQSHRWQQVASIPEEHFEAAVEMAKNSAGEVTTAFMLREAKKSRTLGKPAKGERAERMREELAEAKTRGVSMLSTYLRLTIRALQAQQQFDEDEAALVRELREVLAAISTEGSHPTS